MDLYREKMRAWFLRITGRGKGGREKREGREGNLEEKEGGGSDVSDETRREGIRKRGKSRGREPKKKGESRSKVKSEKQRRRFITSFFLSITSLR